VDLVLEDAAVTAADSRGMRLLAAACGPRFVLGVCLHDTNATIPFHERIFAAPVSSLWS
jgi:hypothetical protein